MKNRLILIWIALGLGWPGLGPAVEQIRVMALFPSKAMVAVDGTNRLLLLGKPSPEGVLLISANSREAVIEVDGKRDTYRLGTHIQTSFSKPEAVVAQIWRNGSGGYETVGSINGYTVNMLVDTGATAVAMNAGEAKRLGVRYRFSGKKIMIATASGNARGYAVTLDRVKVGQIEFRNVRAVVVDGSHPKEVLLGMSFLNRVTMEDQGKLLILRAKY